MKQTKLKGYSNCIEATLHNRRLTLYLDKAVSDFEKQKCYTLIIKRLKVVDNFDQLNILINNQNAQFKIKYRPYSKYVIMKTIISYTEETVITLYHMFGNAKHISLYIDKDEDTIQ